MLLSESNLLILDEPTNHLDYGTKELFQKALLQYGGTILIVSHDRAFLDDLVSRVVEIRDGKLYDYPGNYSWFIEKRAGRDAPAPAAKADPAEKLAAELRASAAESRQEARTKEQRRAEAEERNRLYRAKKDFVERLAACEKEIADVEARKEEINGLLCSPEVLADSQRIQSLMIELKEKEETLKELYEEWEELSIKIEEIK